MKVDALGAYYAQQLKTIETMANTRSLWQQDAAATLARAQNHHANTDELFQTLHEMQRLSKIAAAGLENDPAFRAAFLAENLPSWKDFTQPPVSDELQDSLALKLYNVKPGDLGMINIGDGSRRIGIWLAERCRRNGVPFVVNFADSNFAALVINHTDDDGVKRLAAAYVAMTTPVNKIMTCRGGLGSKEIPADAAKSQIMARESRAFSDRVRSGDVFYTLTEIPTPADAQIDGIAYADYIKLFFEMCDQPWDEISKAQLELIKEFNSATHVRITNDDGTDLEMELVDHDGSHFTFCNSLIAKNVPGSEAFSAPRRDSVNGKIVAKGRFKHGQEIIEDLTLEFNKGKLVSWSAAKNVEAFEKEINLDEGARYVGELGIGTNPHLKRHVANGLLVEKIGGSFHVALGAAYSYTSYGNTPVKVDNGNKSALHWDITTMLYGKGGRIYLDGRLIMDDGKFIDPKYDVLNRGWAAIPVAQRPAYWKNYNGPA